MKAAPLTDRPAKGLMKQTDVQNFYHLQMPRWLFSDDKYTVLSLEAKVAYMFLLNRFQLSKLNGWVNEQGEVFIIYTRKSLAKEMRVSYRNRMLMRGIWIIVAIFAPCFQYAAGIIPLFIPSLVIKIRGIRMGVTGKTAQTEPGDGSQSEEETTAADPDSGAGAGDEQTSADTGSGTETGGREN